MPAPKFNFIPERQLSKGGVPQNQTAMTVSIYPNGILVFPKWVVQVYELDRKYVRLFVDIGNKTIGWSFIKGDTTIEDLDDARQMKKNLTSGMVHISIKKILKSLSLEGFYSKKLPVKTYKSQFNENEIMYVELPRDVEIELVSGQEEEKEEVPLPA